MEALKWIVIAFLFPGSVALGVLLAVPALVVGGVLLVLCVCLADFKKYLRNRFHPCRRRTPRPVYWL